MSSHDDSAALHHQEELEHQEWLEYEKKLKADSENYDKWNKTNQKELEIKQAVNG